MVQQRELVDVRAILQVQCAKGAYKMGLYDTSDRYLKKAFHLHSTSSGSSSNMRIVGPIIKLKGEQFKAECMNMDFKDKTFKLQKIIGVLDTKMKA